MLVVSSDSCGHHKWRLAVHELICANTHQRQYCVRLVCLDHRVEWSFSLVNAQQIFIHLQVLLSWHVLSIIPPFFLPCLSFASTGFLTSLPVFSDNCRLCRCPAVVRKMNDRASPEILILTSFPDGRVGNQLSLMPAVGLAQRKGSYQYDW